jgi:hypothetical protein
VLGDNLNIAISAFAGVDVTVGSLGGALDAFLNPIYRDSILAYISVPLLLRVSKQGWGHYLETASSQCHAGVHRGQHHGPACAPP